jgi:hypothetical protein
MKNKLRWHRTPIGRVICFLGSVELAVPVMFFVAIALAWGTYLESTAGTKAARATVYAAWWFIGLMGLVCVSLIFAVITRYPWKKRHVGFITVHAGLITIIAGGFWSLFGRVEGQLPLSTGMESAFLQMDQEQIEILHHDAGSFETTALAAIDHRTTSVRAGGLELRIVGRWTNTTEETYVADDGSLPLRAIELSTGRGPSVWIGESGRETSPAQIDGLRVRILPAGEKWIAAPLDSGDGSGGTVFMVGDTVHGVSSEAAAGDEVVPGWKIVSIRWFERALVNSGGMVEGEHGRDNPAVEVLISDGAGSVEQHRAFASFPDMLMAKQLEGEARSGARLMMKPVEAAGNLLVIHGTPPALAVSYVRADGSSEEFSHSGPLPWSTTVDDRRITILNHFTHARAATRMVEAPKAEGNRPALLVTLASDPTGEPVVLPWRGSVPVRADSSATILRFGPALHELPFAVRLEEFRKVDYPGTEMAMAYESDVLVTLPDGEQEAARIYMNNPYKFGGWKVYQSGFMGTDVSIFSIMKDPGLPLTYLGCTGLCIGLMITFYSRAFSPGHPGIPVPFARKEQRNGARPDHRYRLDAVSAAPVAGPVLDGPAAQPGELDSADELDPGSGVRAGDAPGHVRQAPRGAADRALEVVR